jgi:hypothetical protein
MHGPNRGILLVNIGDRLHPGDIRLNLVDLRFHVGFPHISRPFPLGNGGFAKLILRRGAKHRRLHAREFGPCHLLDLRIRVFEHRNQVIHFLDSRYLLGMLWPRIKLVAPGLRIVEPRSPGRDNGLIRLLHVPPEFLHAELGFLHFEGDEFLLGADFGEVQDRIGIGPAHLPQRRTDDVGNASKGDHVKCLQNSRSQRTTGSANPRYNRR